MSKTFKVVEKSLLLEASNKGIEAIQQDMPGVVIVTGARMVNNTKTGKKDSVEFEFLQQRTLAGRAFNLLGALHEGDDRWNDGRIKMRVWTTLTKKGAVNTLGLSEEDFDNIVKSATGLTDDQRVVVLTPIKDVNTDTGKKKIKIICNETTDVTVLPLAIQRQLETEYKDRYILQAPTGKDNALENQVDENGETIYRWFILGTEDMEDNMIPNKSSISQYLSNKDKKGDNTESSSNNPVSKAFADLAE